MNTNGLSVGTHTITFQSQYNGSISRNIVTAPAVDSDTRHMWRFDEGSGSSTSDVGSYGYTGSLEGDVSWTDGPLGSALDFDGDGDYVSTQSTTSSHNGEVTIEAWIYFEEDLSRYHSIVQHRNSLS